MPDLDEAVNFFIRVLGCELLYRTTSAFDPTGGDWMTRHYGVQARASLRTAMLRYGPSTNVELLAWGNPESISVARELTTNGAGHLAIYVNDLPQAAEYLAKEPGVRVLGAPTVVVGEPNEGTEFLYVILPWGFRLELVRWPPLMPYCTTTTARLVNPIDAWAHEQPARGDVHEQ